MTTLQFKWKKFWLWLALCSISAAPSFYFAVEGAKANIPAMLLGIALFVLAYTFVTSSHHYQKIIARPKLFKSLKWAFALRIMLSICPILITPIAGQAGIAIFLFDIYPGFLSLQISKALGLMPSPTDAYALNDAFLPTFITTITQGILLNLMLLAIACLIWGCYGLTTSGRRRT